MNRADVQAVLTFSELDFARLGLANKQTQDEFTPQFDTLTEGYPFPIQNNPFPVEQSFFTDDFSLDLSAHPHNEFWLDPALDLQQWQTPPSMQTDTSRDISPLATADERVSTPSLNTSFAGLPPLEPQHPTLPRKRSTYFRSPASQPISIPHTNLQRDRTQDPMQRWQDSPPEAEPASLSAIADALSKTTLRKRSSAGSLVLRASMIGHGMRSRFIWIYKDGDVRLLEEQLYRRILDGVIVLTAANSIPARNISKRITTPAAKTTKNLTSFVEKTTLFSIYDWSTTSRPYLSSIPGKSKDRL
ncbi:unnamed protein product [Fusarium equiseti]|uniref:Uncharacterized protein n=1 Tax=Fusarium equiseti TaxID=61235 RepID=A0A8J2JDZ3_FUSEQ|nr:unnamed protein product [Fusarium equiseti]